VTILKTVSVITKRHVALDTSEYHHSLHTPYLTHTTLAFCVITVRPVLIVSSLPMLVEAWAGLATGMDGRGSCPACASIPQSPVGGPNKGVHHMPLGFSGQCPLRGLWLLTCHITNIILIFRAASRIIWTWRLWNGRSSRRWAWLLFILWLLWCIIFILIAVRIHYDFSYFISRQHEPVSHTEHRHVAFSTKLQHS